MPARTKNGDSLAWFPTWDDVANAWTDYWYDWLYESGPWDEYKYNEYNLYSNLPGTKHGIAMAEGKRANEEYMARYGMSWSDVMHPEKLPGSGSYSSGLGGSLNFVSDNVKRLYR